MRTAPTPGKRVTQVRPAQRSKPQTPPVHQGSLENHPAGRDSTENRPIRRGSPNDRRHRAARSFILRAVTLAALIGGTAYLAWFSPWARPIHSLTVESAQPTFAPTGQP